MENVFVDSLMVFDDKPIFTENFSESDQTEKNRTIVSQSIGSFICDICKMNFDSKPLIERHIMETHVKSIQTEIKEGAFEIGSCPNKDNPNIFR